MESRSLLQPALLKCSEKEHKLIYIVPDLKNFDSIVSTLPIQHYLVFSLLALFLIIFNRNSVYSSAWNIQEGRYAFFDTCTPKFVFSVWTFFHFCFSWNTFSRQHYPRISNDFCEKFSLTVTNNRTDFSFLSTTTFGLCVVEVCHFFSEVLTNIWIIHWL